MQLYIFGLLVMPSLLHLQDSEKAFPFVSWFLPHVLVGLVLSLLRSTYERIPYQLRWFSSIMPFITILYLLMNFFVYYSHLHTRVWGYPKLCCSSVLLNRSPISQAMLVKMFNKSSLIIWICFSRTSELHLIAIIKLIISIVLSCFKCALTYKLLNLE